MSPQHKNVLVKLREIMLIICTLVTMGGTGGIFIKIGNFQANFDNECKRTDRLELSLVENYKENKADHIEISKDITTINLTLAKYMGNKYEYKIKED